MAKVSVNIVKRKDKDKVKTDAKDKKAVESKTDTKAKKVTAVKETKSNVTVTVTVRENKVDTKPKTSRDSEPEESKIVIPGELLDDNLNVLAGQGTYRDGAKVYSKYTGLLKKKDHMITVIPLNGIYVPKKGDFVVGEISSVSFSNWWVDIRSPYKAKLPVNGVSEFIERGADLSKYYKKGEVVFARIDSLTEDSVIPIFMKDRMCRKLYNGRVVDIVPAKVPRLIGREGTMIHLIKDSCNCIIYVGQNGRIWIKGDDEILAEKAIKMVEKFAHKSGLTDMISKFLESELAKKGASKSDAPGSANKRK